MAERRMFAKSIIKSDAFLELPATSKVLYFYLMAESDDDGFINSPKSVMRNAMCSEDDMKVLISKKFVIPFDSGVVVIKHWRIHNYIRGDRKKPTNYIEEMSQLSVKENGSYTLCQPTDRQLSVNCPSSDGIGKDRLGKDSIGKSNNVLSSAEDDKKKERKETTKKVIEYLNEKTGKHYKPVDSNLKIINARLDEGYTYEDFVKVIDVKYSEWVNTDYEKFIRPATLFAKSHFDNYLNQKEEVKRGAEFFGY